MGVLARSNECGLGSFSFSAGLGVSTLLVSVAVLSTLLVESPGVFPLLAVTDVSGWRMGAGGSDEGVVFATADVGSSAAAGPL